MLSINGSAATIYPLAALEMSLAGDTVLVFRRVRLSSRVARPRPRHSLRPGRVFGRGRFGPARGGSAPGTGPGAGLAAGVRSPLAEAGFTKADVRTVARELGLPVWDAPAAPCLSSRVAYGIAITPGRLAQVEQGEA